MDRLNVLPEVEFVFDQNEFWYSLKIGLDTFILPETDDSELLSLVVTSDNSDVTEAIDSDESTATVLFDSGIVDDNDNFSITG